MGVPDHLTCLLRNLYAGQEEIVRIGHGIVDCSELGKEYVKAVYSHPAYLTYMQSTSLEMPGWINHKLESRLLGKNVNNLRYADDTSLMKRKQRGTKEPLDEGKRKERKDGLKLNIQKTKIMASGPITSWQIKGETVKAVTDFIFLGSIITVAIDCSHEIKRCLLLGSKAMTNLDSILKIRDITLPTKVPLIKAMVFPVTMYG